MGVRGSAVAAGATQRAGPLATAEYPAVSGETVSPLQWGDFRLYNQYEEQVNCLSF